MLSPVTFDLREKLEAGLHKYLVRENWECDILTMFSLGLVTTIWLFASLLVDRAFSTMTPKECVLQPLGNGADDTDQVGDCSKRSNG